MPVVPSSDPSPREAEVLTRAVLRAGDLLGLPQRTVASSIGVSEASVSRFRRGRTIAPDSKEGELALLMLRLFRSLDALVGGDAARARAWMHADNRHLGGIPSRLILTVTGLVHVVEYLDAMRGKS